MNYGLNSAEDPVLQWVTFCLYNETYGINVMQVQEVLKVTEITPVPGAPEYVLGIINLRGNVVTVVNTRMRFDLPSTEVDDSSRIIIIESGEKVIGLMVDSVAEVVYLRVSEIESTPQIGSEEGAKYIQGVHSRKEGLLILVDVNRLLTNEEWEEIAEI